MSTTTIRSEDLLPDLQRLVQDLKADLLERLREHPAIDAGLRADAYAPIEKGGRTAQAYEIWRDDYLEQVAVAWVLACVFVRYLEDNGLIAETYLAGVGDRRRAAEDAHLTYFRTQPRDPNDRDYLLDVFRRVGSLPAARELFAEGQTPLWAVGPTGDGAKKLLDFWRKLDPETGTLVRSFRAESGDTRFLGDLYQDLSEAARKKYALLQTPGFVEEFILDRTLEPAIAEFGLEHVTLIDPTCGSGHFLLGAFRRLFAAWSRREPGTEPTELARRILEGQVFGVDVNPFAVAIARFRLIVEALHACGITRLKDAPGWHASVAHGDSLYHGARFDRSGRVVAEQRYLPGMEPDPLYAIEDPAGLARILGRQHHVVVGNPPYITVKDSALSVTYRARYSTCHQKYSLAVPFTERFFELALAAPNGRAGAGYVGMITANSFMKREFGKKLIEEFFPRVDLTYIIDTSGAYIPGHGTPTVILLGRNRNPIRSEVRAALGIRGEPSTPDDPAQGLVWRTIVDHLDNGQAQNEFVTVTNMDRATFGKHPWSIGGGGASDLKETIQAAASLLLGELADSIGISSVTGEDDVYTHPDARTIERLGVKEHITLVLGDMVRDWAVMEPVEALWPYGGDLYLRKPEDLHYLLRLLWPYKTSISQRRRFGTPMLLKGAVWYEWQELYKQKLRTPLSIVFAFVATHNHFVLDQGGKVFNRSAPIIKLPADATEDDHLALLGLLNSSTACFWMKQNFQTKGSSGIGRGVFDERWEFFYEHTGAGVGAFPVLDNRAEALPLVRELDTLAREIIRLSPPELVKREVPTGPQLEAARRETKRLQARMVSLQEELDWLCYRLYELMESAVTPDGGYDKPYQDPPGIKPGERAFEIALARLVAAGEVQTSWFARHGSTPITEIPEHWPETYRTLVARRCADFRENPNIALIERPEYKRRWLREPWADQVQRALRGWLLVRLETERYWPKDAAPELTSCARLAERAAHDADFLQVAALYRGRADFDLPRLVEELVAAEAVPFLPVLRYKPSGLTKRQVWERTWEMQRAEDRGQYDQHKDGPIPVPPKYASADFQTADIWRLRGKLDVPKERFVSYPHCSRDGDPSLVVGWAGWNHLQQATALAAYYDRMKTREGWMPERLAPLLAGLDQLVPWLLQWHNDVHPEYDLRMGDYYRDFVRDEAQALGLTLEAVRAWEPPAKAKGGRGRRARS